MLQDIPAASEIRSESARILQSADFDFQPSRSTRFGDWLKDKLEDIVEWFGQLHASSPGLYWLLLIACLVILAAIFAHGGIVVTRAFRAARGKDRRSLLKRDSRSPRKLFEDARAAARRGDAAAALTLYLRGAILGLDVRGLVRATDTATVREYLGMLGRHPAERGLLSRFLTHYEPGVFGRRRLPDGSLDECDGLARRLAGESA